MSELRAADVLARRLYDAGIRHAFGMPGGEVLTFVDALEAAGIQFVLIRHENAGGFMAEGVHHATGAPALLVTTVGPGALNCINVVENARQDRVPMIVVTGALDGATAARYTHQALNQSRVFATVCKESLTYDAAAAEALADRAVAIATDAQPGPVHIDLPIAVADAPALSIPALRRHAILPAAPAETAELAALRARVAQAKRPLILAGVDAMNEGAAPAIQQAAEALGAPVITTYKAKGLIPEDHALALGGAGLSPKADAVLLPLVAEADVILLAGYDPIEMRIGWQDPWDTAEACVIDIAQRPNTHYMHQASHNLHAGVAPSLAALTAEVEPGPRWPAGWIDGVKAALSDAFAPEADWGPGVIIETCQKLLPPETRATADSGAHRILLSQMWRCTYPRALIQSSAFCTMGCAVPMAMGAQLAEPDRPTVSFSGDAGFLMVAGELATAADLKLRTIFVVFVDRSLALIEKKQRERQLTNAGVDFGWTDFAALGRAMGGAGETVSSRVGLDAALKNALAAPTFTVIAAEIERGAYDGRI